VKHGRKIPYTKIGVRRLPCTRCGNKSESQWSICADNNLFRPLCTKCDIDLNRLVLKWVNDKDINKKMEIYILSAEP
jgi:endogenous inhibitor of DNA gyrase (YacG/DUF329 family)